MVTATTVGVISVLTGCATTAGGATAMAPVPKPGVGHPLKVACVGDSITFGLGLANRQVDAYPAVMGRQLGPDYDVRGFAVSGATTTRTGPVAIWGLDEFREAGTFNPDIVVIHLGTNDTKRVHWKSRSMFVKEYGDLVDHFLHLPSHPAVFACLPIPVFDDRFGIKSATLENGVIPGIMTVAKEKGIRTIDVHGALVGRSDLTHDMIHPSETGTIRMATVVGRAIAM